MRTETTGLAVKAWVEAGKGEAEVLQRLTTVAPCSGAGPGEKRQHRSSAEARSIRANKRTSVNQDVGAVKTEPEVLAIGWRGNWR